MPVAAAFASVVSPSGLPRSRFGLSRSVAVVSPPLAGGGTRRGRVAASFRSSSQAPDNHRFFCGQRTSSLRCALRRFVSLLHSIPVLASVMKARSTSPDSSLIHSRSCIDNSPVARPLGVVPAARFSNWLESFPQVLPMLPDALSFRKVLLPCGVMPFKNNLSTVRVLTDGGNEVFISAFKKWPDGLRLSY